MRLTDLPRPTDRAVYEQTRQQVVRKYTEFPGIEAVLEFGTIPHPGISDMDFFVIVTPDTHVTLPHFSTYTEQERFAMVHRHFVISARTFPHLNYIDPWFVGVESLYDPQQRFSFRKEHFDVEGYRSLSLNFIYQKLVYGCLPLLAEIFRTQTVPCRTFFEEIKLFQYFLREWKKLNVDYGEEDSALGSYAALAQQWFTLSAVEQQKKIEEAVRHYARSIEWTTHALLEALKHAPARPLPRACHPQTHAQHALLRQFPQSFIVDTGERVFVYQQGCRLIRIAEEVFHYPLPTGGTVRRTVYLLPLPFASLPTTHLTLEGCLSHYYQSRAFTDLPSLPRWENPYLTSLYEIANRDVWETRNVRNGKHYEIIYGYRPPGDQPKTLKQHVHAMLSGTVSALSHSPLRSMFRRGSKRTLWESSPLG